MMWMTWDSAAPLRISDGTTKTHSDMGTVYHGNREYRFVVARWFDKAAKAERVSYDCALYQLTPAARGRSVPWDNLKAVREKVIDAFKVRVYCKAQQQQGIN